LDTNTNRCFLTTFYSSPPATTATRTTNINININQTKMLFNNQDELVWKENFLERSKGMYDEDHRKLAVREFLKASSYTTEQATTTTSTTVMDDKLRACLGLMYTKCQLEGKDFDWAASVFSARASSRLCLEQSTILPREECSTSTTTNNNNNKAETDWMVHTTLCLLLTDAIRLAPPVVVVETREDSLSSSSGGGGSTCPPEGRLEGASS
jgi:hypothetical protein